jgi:hypothetical protein
MARDAGADGPEAVAGSLPARFLAAIVKRMPPVPVSINLAVRDYSWCVQEHHN